MKRGKTAAETCALNGWTVGTLVRGHETWINGRGSWSTWRITAIGEAAVLARTVLIERTGPDAGPADRRTSWEHTVSFDEREWTEVRA